MADRFFIAPYDTNSGLQTDVKPFLIPDEAFSELTNAYVFRGRVRKRFGSRYIGDNSLVSRFRINIGITAAGKISENIRTFVGDPTMPTAVGQSFSIGTVIFTIYNPAPGPQQMLRSDGLLDVALFDLTTSIVAIMNAPDGEPVYFYPSFPVMGLIDYETNDTNNDFLIGFDTRYAYKYVSGWTRLNGEAVGGDAVWHGSNSEFFWGCTWTGISAADKVHFVTNFNELETRFMRYFLTTTNQWNSFRPQISATPDYLYSARIIVPFRNRLVCFNTWEGNVSPGSNYQNRCRYSQIGSPLDVNAWRQDIAGRGNAIDAPTTEAIITVEFIKDRLIVFFEKSTWELAYTGNQVYPFTWQQINTELGAESTFSIVPFDKVAIGVGNVGIHACNGANVERIDTKIPDTVFDIHNINSGIDRVYGIRDYYVEMVYWTFPDVSSDTTFPYPNRVLIYNYKTGTWAFNNDSITCFGYFQPTTGVTWDSTILTWDDPTTWDSGSIQAQFRQVIGGNQQGYTFICDANKTTNASVLQITNITYVGALVTITSFDHNLRIGEYIYLEGITGTGTLDTILNNTIYKITGSVTQNTFTIIADEDLTGVYSGAGLISRVSNISIKTKEYNFYAKQGRNASVSKVDFLVDTTALGKIQVDFFVSTNAIPMVIAGSTSGSLLGTNTLDTFPYSTFESSTTRVWHPVYFQADGEVIQLYLHMDDAQMRDINVRECDFQMHAMCVHAQSTSSRLQ